MKIDQPFLFLGILFVTKIKTELRKWKQQTNNLVIEVQNSRNS